MGTNIDSFPRKILSCLRVSTAVFASFVVFMSSSTGATKSSFDFSRKGRSTPLKITANGVNQIQQGYNFKVWLANDLVMGKSAFNNQKAPPDYCSVGIGCEYPIGSCIEHLFGAGPWIGGLINGVRRVTEAYNGDMSDSETLPDSDYSTRNQFWVTSVSDSLYDPNRQGYYKYSMNRRGYDDDGDGIIDEDELDGLDNDHDWVKAADDIGADGIPDSLEVGCKGVYNAVTNPDPAGDDYDPASYDSCNPNYNNTFPLKNNKDKYSEKNGIPDHGEPHVDEDYGAVSDHDVYVASTDTSLNSHEPKRHHKMGIKIFQKSYAWDRKDAGAVLPIEYYFVNIGNNTIKDVFVAFFADMDIGPVDIPNYYQSNYAAYLPDVRTGYIYNAVDRGSTPLGVTILGAPGPFSEMELRWQWFDFTYRISPGTDDSVLYLWLDGEKGSIWADPPITNPSDVRFLLSMGPIATMNPGDTLKMAVALVSGNCVDQCSGSLKDNASKALTLWNRGLRFPIIPPSPRLKITEGFRKAHIEWGPHLGGPNPTAVWDDVNLTAQMFGDTNWRRIHPPAGHSTGGRIFEGFRLYRSEYPSGELSTFSLVRQYDVKGDGFEYNYGLDSIYDDPYLQVGKTYWYAVTSFSIPDMSIIEVPDSTGGIRLDTLFGEEHESSILDNRTKVVATRQFGLNNTPRAFKLYPPFPNPFNPSTTIAYDLPEEADVNVSIYNIAGDLVCTVFNGRKEAGSYEITWNGNNDYGLSVSNGVYLCRIIASTGTATFSQSAKLLYSK
jgi:hypothetical protein